MWYKLSLKYGWRKKYFPIGGSVNGPFYQEVEKQAEDFVDEWKAPLLEKSEKILSGEFTYFSFHKKQVGELPNWFFNPFEVSSHSQPKKHWTEISDFGEGDIKVVWELSRFDWLTVLARAHKVTADKKYLTRINELLHDWSLHNPVNQGPNWKCGQETSIRLMKLLSTAFILDQFSAPLASLQKLVYQHLQRIRPNLTYAVIQDNNHGTSESAALYIGAAWLMQTGYKASDLASIKKQGKKVFEERVVKLVQAQGTFAQRSMTYHRVMVDTATFVLHMMSELNEPEFSQKVIERLERLGEWQYKMTLGKHGDAPNFGSNDGAMFENLHSCDYRDFRVSTQSLFGLLSRERAYDDIAVSEALYWRGSLSSLSFPLRNIALPATEILDKQILLLRNGTASVFVKIPEATFRPGNDAFHIDLWIDGENRICDSGTFSYNDVKSDHYKSVAAHNTVQFGEHEQMPKISRFLNGSWIVPDHISEVKEDEGRYEWTGRYKDYKGNQHERQICLSVDSLSVKDKVTTGENAVARYHFSTNDSASAAHYAASQPTITSVSLYYYQKQEATVLEIPASNDGQIEFTYTFDKNTSS